MAVAGAPEPRADHAEAGLQLARAILAAAADWRARNALDLQLRVGLASGPVVAGVIGQRRMLFDLWGETVNLAARMESSSLPGRIQVAGSTWSLLRRRYRFAAREIEAKGIGLMTAHLLEE
jgi:class 3 adenylate cyclase